MQQILDSFAKHKFMHTLGATLTHVSAGEVVIEMPFRDDLVQQHGFMHAGAITTIVDTACGYAALTQMPEGSEVVTVEFKVNFMSPAIGENFVAKASVVRAGKTLTVTQGDVYAISENGAKEKHIATMQATMFCVAAG
ncbi:MAG: PaaI family thioesterase [Chloroflexota bacterium]